MLFFVESSRIRSSPDLISVRNLPLSVFVLINWSFVVFRGWFESEWSGQGVNQRFFVVIDREILSPTPNSTLNSAAAAAAAANAFVGATYFGHQLPSRPSSVAHLTPSSSFDWEIFSRNSIQPPSVRPPSIARPRPSLSDSD